jgi:hypothetical protein
MSMSLKESRGYSADPRCLLRIARARSPRALTLTDGTRLDAGELVVGTHLWNEHLPREGASLAPGLALMRGSLQELARFLQAQPELSDARAIYGEMGFLPDARLPQARRIAERLGFELVPGERPGWNPLSRAFWRNAVSWWYLRKFNPAGLRQTGFGRMRRCEAWMSRDQLLARYGH